MYETRTEYTTVYEDREDDWGLDWSWLWWLLAIIFLAFALASCSRPRAAVVVAQPAVVAAPAPVVVAPPVVHAPVYHPPVVVAPMVPMVVPHVGIYGGSRTVVRRTVVTRSFSGGYRRGR